MNIIEEVSRIIQQSSKQLGAKQSYINNHDIVNRPGRTPAVYNRQTHNKDIIILPSACSPKGDESLVRLTLKRQIEELPSRSPPVRG